MGMFVKTLPVVSSLTTEEAYKKSMAEAVADMQKQFVETQGRSFYPFTEMVERHGIRPEIMYAYQGSIDDAGMEKEEAIQLDTVKMPLSVSIYPEADGKYTIALEYDGGLYYGFGANTDIVTASVEAYIDCINKFKEKQP